MSNLKVNKVSQDMYDLVKYLFPMNRSITGNGFRESLKIIQEHIPIDIFEVPSGEKVFDWVVPLEWNIREAYIENSKGEKIIDMKNNNLHVVGYSIPINKELSLNELDEHLYSLEEQPNVIPYVTSYYKKRWGFCLNHEQRMQLKEDNYHVVIDSDLKNGHLTYGELLIKGKSEKEIFLSTYLCHPSMANNELSGPAVVTYLTKWILSEPRYYSYRIIIIPETIGSITYLSKNLTKMKENIIAGFNLTCVGDNNNYSFLPSRYGNTLADQIAKNILTHKQLEFKKYSYLERGSDERQYCSPGVDLPVISIMRSKYGEYEEYHTSADNLDFISAEGLFGAYELHMLCIEALENNFYYKANEYCEPQLGKRGLYPSVSIKGDYSEIRKITNFLAYADGKNDLVTISNLINIPIWELYQVINHVKELISINDEKIN